MTGPPSSAPPNPWTRLFAAVNGVFIITVLVMVVAGLTRRPPLLAGLLDHHGLLIIGVEVGVILGLAVLMMAAERRATLRRLEEREAALLHAAPKPPAELKTEGDELPSGDRTA